MSLKSFVPFINSADRFPQVNGRILYLIERLGHSPVHVDNANILFFEKADILKNRVPLILYASHPQTISNDQYLLQTLLSKFPTAVKIEAQVNDIPRIISEQQKWLSLWPSESKNERVKTIISYIYTQIHNRNLCLTSIAEYFKTTIHKIENDFHKSGIVKGVWHFIIEVRMKEAKRLLKETALSAKEISFILGHEDYSSFTRSFKHINGFSPSEVKKMQSIP